MGCTQRLGKQGGRVRPLHTGQNLLLIPIALSKPHTFYQLD